MASVSNALEEPWSCPTGHIPFQSGKQRPSYEQVIASGMPNEQTYEQRDLASTGIIGSSPTLRAILDEVKIVAATDSTVLIQGETGTGKELIASAIHTLSLRRRSNFV